MVKIQISKFGDIEMNGRRIGSVDGPDGYLILLGVCVGRFSKYGTRAKGIGRVRRWLPGAVEKAGSVERLVEILTGPNHPAPGQFHPIPRTKKEEANYQANLKFLEAMRNA